ncbi:MAG TPA: sensor histidine kinase [Burkholderiaceae bacterium]|nr:sensor histidine kinase [Burkholderiaceae bacterium]
MFRELVAHLRRERARLREEWARRIHDARLLTAMSREETFDEATALYDKYVAVLETGSVSDLQQYARDLSRRIIQRGVQTREVVGIVLLLRDVLARSLFKKYRGDFELLDRVFDAYEPAANRIANTVAVSFVEQRERVIRRQQKALQMLHVQEEERKRISRELHDEVGQAVVAINAYLAVSQRDAVSEPHSLFRQQIADIEKLLLGTMDRVHHFARELRPAMLDDLGLVPALRSYLKDYAERTGLLVHFERGARDAPLTAEQKTALFRIAQESLNNVARHAEATEVEVCLNRVKSGVQLRVKDNGKGFSMEQRRSRTEKQRLGLQGMQERVGLMNGRFLVRSAPGAGTTVVAELPLHGIQRPETLGTPA